MSRLRIALGTIGVCATASISGHSLAAPPVAGYVGWQYSSVAGCPYIVWRLARHDNGKVTGIVYYSDLSGVSSATGTLDQTGKLHLGLTSALGNGPVGTVNGSRTAKGAVNAVLSGQGCANAKIATNQISDLNAIPTASGMKYNPTG
jgi:hypothetical protein